MIGFWAMAKPWAAASSSHTARSSPVRMRLGIVRPAMLLNVLHQFGRGV